MKDLKQTEKQSEEDKTDIYSGLVDLVPFTVFDNGQLSEFIADLVRNKDIDEKINEAFNVLWSCACIDIDGYGNNIWNLKAGQFRIYESDDVTVEFEKKEYEGLDKYSDQGRATFVFKSDEGNVVIKQHEYNKRIFLVYLESNTTENFYSALKHAEAEALEINERASGISQLASAKNTDLAKVYEKK